MKKGSKLIFVFAYLLLSCNSNQSFFLELVSKESNHLAAILHFYAGGLNFMN